MVDEFMLNTSEFRVLFLHETTDHISKEKPDIFDDLLASFDKFDALVFVSELARQEWLQTVDFPHEHTYIIHNSVAEDAVRALYDESKEAVRRRLALPLERVVIISVGTLSHIKGQAILLSAVPKLRELFSEPEVVLVGRASQGYGIWIKKLIEELGIGGCVRIVGETDQVLDYIYAADLLVHPARYEAQGRVLLEAMALGTPVVASRVGGITEIIADSTNGRFCDRERPEELADLIKVMFTTTGELERLAANARADYWTRFSRAYQDERVGQMLQGLRYLKGRDVG